MSMGLLTGIRVVEMGLWAAGPAVGGILADWGAEVIKVEAPSGDPMRHLFRALSGSRQEKCPPFDVLNRGKKSVAIDVNRPSGTALLERLLATADVFVTNMRPGFLERIDLSPERVIDDFPRLVYANLTAYGDRGPDRDAPGFDIAAFSARSGLLDRSTAPGSAPPTLAGGIGDNVTAMALVAGIMAALWRRDTGGGGQLVTTSLLRSGIYAISMDVSTRLGLGRVASPPDRTSARNPLMNSYQAADGKWFWLVGAESDRHWPRLVACLGDPALEADERFSTPRNRRHNAEELVAMLDAAFAQRTRGEWSESFDEHDVWWAPVNNLDDVLADPQVEAVGAIVNIDEDGGTVATPVDFGAYPSDPTGPPPPLGRDTREILREVGVDDAEWDSLREQGVVG